MAEARGAQILATIIRPRSMEDWMSCSWPVKQGHAFRLKVEGDT